MGQSKPVADIGDTQGFDWYLLYDRWALVQRYHPPSIASSFPSIGYLQTDGPLIKIKTEAKVCFYHLSGLIARTHDGWLAVRSGVGILEEVVM